MGWSVYRYPIGACSIGNSLGVREQNTSGQRRASHGNGQGSKGLLKWECIREVRKHAGHCQEEFDMDTTTLLIIVLVILLVGGGGWYGRGRWY